MYVCGDSPAITKSLNFEIPKYRLAVNEKIKNNCQYNNEPQPNCFSARKYFSISCLPCRIGLQKGKIILLISGLRDFFFHQRQL